MSINADPSMESENEKTRLLGKDTIHESHHHGDESKTLLDMLREKLTPENTRICIFFVLLVAFGIANSYTGRWNQLKFGNNYAFFNNQFTTFAYAIIAQGVTTYRYYFTSEITADMKAFPWWKFAMFGFFDGACAFLFSIGAPSTPASLQNVINQSIIPCTMLASFVYLRQRYKWPKLVGATIILIGATIALIPDFLPAKSGHHHNQNVTTAAPTPIPQSHCMGRNVTLGKPPKEFVWYSVLIYFSNNLPGACSNVAKEAAFNNQPMDVYYMGSWVAWWQLFFSLLFLPIINLKPFGGIPFICIPNQILLGLQCFAGHNNLPGDNCSYNYIATSAYIIINFVYNVLILVITKYAGATMFTLAFAIRLPLTQIVYWIHFLMRSGTEPFTWETILALVVVLIGFGIYSVLGGEEEAAPGVEGESEVKALVVGKHGETVRVR